MTATLITIIHIFICVMLVLIVLLQQGKGADVGATFGGGGSTMFGASGADNFLTKVTTFSAICFMLTSIFLAVNSKSGGNNSGEIFQGLPSEQPAAVNVIPEPAASEPTTEAGKADAAPADSNPPAASANEEGSTTATSDAAGENDAATAAAPAQPTADKPADLAPEVEAVLPDANTSEASSPSSDSAAKPVPAAEAAAGQ